jgi:hypothetical protein
MLVADDWLWGFLDPVDLTGAVGADPIYEATATTPLLTESQAQAAIIRSSNFFVPKPENYLDQVRAALGNDQATFDQVLQAAHWHWLGSALTADRRG